MRKMKSTNAICKSLKNLKIGDTIQTIYGTKGKITEIENKDIVFYIKKQDDYDLIERNLIAKVNNKTLIPNKKISDFLHGRISIGDLKIKCKS